MASAPEMTDTRLQPRLLAVRTRLRLASSFLSVVSGLCLMGACVDFLWTWSSIDGARKPVVIIRILLGLMGIVLAVFAVVTREAMAFKFFGDHEGVRLAARSASDLQELAKNVTSRYGQHPERLDLYRNLLTGYRNSIARAVEEYSLEGGCLRQRVTLQYVVGPELLTSLEAVESVLVPIARVRKGALLDNLEVRSADGSVLPVLPYPAVLGIQLFTLHTLFTEAFGLRLPKDEDGRPAMPSLPDHLLLEVERTRTRLMKTVAALEPPDEDAEKKALTHIQKLTSLLLTDGRLPVRPSLVGVLCEFVECFGRTYPVVAELPTPAGSDRLVVEYSKNVKLVTVDDGPKDRLRKIIGLSPYKFRIPLTLPYLAQTYHFRMRLGSGQYLFDQWVQDATTGKPATFNGDQADRTRPIRITDGDPYIRIRRRMGLPYAHLYTRDMNHAWPRPIATIVRFHEIPPGAAGSAAAMATVTFAFICAIGSLVSNGTASSDIPALLLALPAVSAALLGQNLDHDVLQNTSLMTRFGLFNTFILAGAGILLYLAQVNGRLHFGAMHVTFFGNSVTFPVQDRAWVALTALSFVNAIWLVVIVILRGVTFKEMSSQQFRVEPDDFVFPKTGT